MKYIQKWAILFWVALLRSSIYTACTHVKSPTIREIYNSILEWNVYYDTMGHTVFIEDAAETKNYIAYNLVIQTNPSFSLLNTDATPACFWITNPNNIFRGNITRSTRCVGTATFFG